MESIIFVEFTIISLVIFGIAFWVTNGGESNNRKWAKVRVRVNDKRTGHMPEPQDEEEFDPPINLELVFLGTALIFLLVILMQN